MKNKITYIFSLVLLSSISFLFTGCSEDAPKPAPEPDSTILIYAVATNSLAGNLISDKNEMLIAASDIDLKRNNVLLFQAVYEYDENNQRTGNGKASLLKLVESKGLCGWDTIREFTYDTVPLDPKRINEVIDIATTQFPAHKYGLIFWSHSTASDPYFATAKTTSMAVQLPMEYSFGQDLAVGSGKDYYQLNVDELANAIPDNLFNFIWFDSCYMSNIETIYQLRNKCNYFVGYPTEVLDDGMPYQYTLPLLASGNPDIVGAAEKLFDYYQYDYTWHIATIAVVDMSKIDALSDFCREIYKGNISVPATANMHKYTNNRQTSGPFYDLGDYTREVASINGGDWKNEVWNSILNECVIYKAATTYDFNNKRIDQERYSGISTYVYGIGNTPEKSAFYESLDWFNTVYPDGM